MDSGQVAMDSGQHRVPKRQKNVRDPNLGMMSDFHISVNNSQIRTNFLMKIVVKLLFIH
jgi:hypothetical protein